MLPFWEKVFYDSTTISGLHSGPNTRYILHSDTIKIEKYRAKNRAFLIFYLYIYVPLLIKISDRPARTPCVI